MSNSLYSRSSIDRSKKVPYLPRFYYLRCSLTILIWFCDIWNDHLRWWVVRMGIRIAISNYLCLNQLRCISVRCVLLSSRFSQLLALQNSALDSCAVPHNHLLKRENGEEKLWKSKWMVIRQKNYVKDQGFSLHEWHSLWQWTISHITCNHPVYSVNGRYFTDPNRVILLVNVLPIFKSCDRLISSIHLPNTSCFGGRCTTTSAKTYILFTSV